MKNILKSVLTSLCVAGLLPLWAQESQQRGWQLTEIYIFGGGQNSTADERDINNFFILAPQSRILAQDLNGYRPSFINPIFGPAFSFLVGFNRADDAGKPTRISLRAGISYRNIQPVGTSLFRNNQVRFDTLRSSTTGAVMFRDSITSRNISMSHLSEQLRLDFSVIFRLLNEKRFTLYAGLGTAAGMSVNAYTTIEYTLRESIQFTDPTFGTWGASNTFENGFDSDLERFSNKAHFAASMYIPFGWDWRLGARSEFWKKISIFGEYHTQLNITSIPELKTFSNVGFNGSIGLRVSDFR